MKLYKLMAVVMIYLSSLSYPLISVLGVATLIGSTTMLTACSTAPVERVVTKTNTVVVTIPLELLEKTTVPAPPVKPDEYVKMTADQKEETLSTYIVELLATIKKLTGQINKISEYQYKQLQNLKASGVTP